MEVKGKSVYVGLSGGVDSAVSAALLKEAGALVTGVFIKGWYPPGMPCTWAKDRRDAMRVAAKLKIPFRTLDASSEYKRSVIDYLISEYRAGHTPNPDAMCNRDVKFGAFYKYAMDSGADLIATGHYRSGEKDQSYFLWAVTKDVLNKTVFPIGNMEKKDVRQLARKFGLPVALKPDSQGVCFLGPVSIEEFLSRELTEVPGQAVDDSGSIVGMHNSVLLHTIGERVPLSGARRGPWYVLSKNVEKNILTVGKERVPKYSSLKTIHYSGANWIGPLEDVSSAQTRYRGPVIAGRIEGGHFEANEPLPELPAPGQSIVFFRGRDLLGGAMIS